jgi:hypothetical protein
MALTAARQAVRKPQTKQGGCSPGDDVADMGKRP